MSLILSSGDAQIIRNRGTYREYIFYTNRNLKSNTFKLIHSLEFTYGGGSTDNTYDVSFQVGEGGDKFHLGTFHQTSQKTVARFSQAQQLFTLDRDYYAESIFVVRIAPTYFASPTLSAHIGDDVVTTTSSTVVVDAQHNLLSFNGDTTGTNLDAIEVGALLFDTDASYTHIAGGPGDYLDVLPVIQHLTQNHTKWNLSFPMYAFPSTVEQTLLYMRADTSEENAIRLLVNTANQLVLERYENYSETQLHTYTRPAGYDTLMNELGKLQYSTADGVSSPAGFEGTVAGLLTNETFARRNAIVFPADSTTRYIDLSAYSTGPHIQDTVTFSFWVNTDNSPINEKKTIFVIKNAAVVDNEERFQIWVRKNDDGTLTITTIFRGLDGALIVSLQDKAQITQEWTHFAVVVAANRYEIYRDGVECPYNLSAYAPPNTATLYGTFQTIEGGDEVYIGTNRLITTETLEQQPVNYSNLIADGTVIAQYETADGIPSIGAISAVGAPTSNNTVTIDGRTGIEFNYNGWDINALGPSLQVPNLTISTWYHPNANPGSWLMDWVAVPSVNASSWFWVRIRIYNDGDLDLWVRDDTNGFNLRNKIPLLNDWNHIVLMITTTSPYLQVYINNAPVSYTPSSAGTIDHTQSFSSYDVKFGARIDLAEPMWGGVVSDMLFFNRELTVAEIGYLFNSLPTTSTTFNATFNDPFRGRLSDFQMFPRALSAAEIADLGTPETETTETVTTGTKFTASVDNVTGGWKTVVLSNDQNNLFAKVDTDNTGPLPGHTFETNEARFGGPTSGDAFDGLIGPIKTLYETEQLVTTVDTVASDNIDPWTLKMRIEEI